ncbi:hypothetical protein PF010_g8483 [Phytophthora fragariae]|uniref:Uncharacterized protein n=2 Tax=Phytophthora TaxID=4783 RepID=A0A6A3F6N8_9STRA|nr:hypothetical protein PF003_g35964 [Phytophthora fragariae]KAE8940336.1 hypothetical protein PF009_g9839 [Phytophthora fragariae]KAE9117750.1 hypothetical protein PF010_g8483 [Phytophthora fragariae]KAE9325888.1 hypothetical protein PR003_g16364 [Phytophthora rubi]KAE9352102.1 hypothetical protein PF008_g5619 [Phytophthora fragariae]
MSAIALVSGYTRDVNAEKAPDELCRELRMDEIPEVINDFCKAAVPGHRDRLRQRRHPCDQTGT